MTLSPTLPRRERQRGARALRRAGREGDAEAGVGRLGAADRLEHEVDRRPARDQPQRLGDVRQHATLGRNVETLDDLIEHAQHVAKRRHAVRHRIDPDHGVTRTDQKPVQRRRRDAAQVVGRVIGLQPNRQAAGKPDGIAEARHHLAFACHRHQILIAHQLRYGCHHLGDEAGGHRGEDLRGCLVRQQPVAKLAHREACHRREGGRIMAVDDQAGDVVILVGDQRLDQKLLQRHVGEHETGRHALLGRARGDAGETVARPWGARACHYLPEVVEGETLRLKDRSIAHRPLAGSGRPLVAGRTGPSIASGCAIRQSQVTGGEPFARPVPEQPWADPDRGH